MDGGWMNGWMDGGWMGNSFLLGFSSLANRGVSSVTVFCYLLIDNPYRPQ
jgi:hypothetical protein